MNASLLLALSLPSPAAAAGPAGGPAVLRHALLVGVNDGGEGMEPLRYANDDAGRVAEVLQELGGFSPDRVTVLRDPDRDELQAALREHSRWSAAHGEDLFLFYYSGHADAQGLRMGDERVPYAELKQSIRDMPAEVRLGVLDACRSGEITRLKGLEVSSPFARQDDLGAEGEAWLTATSADESAQESDRIGGSFFTHFLVSGLRGPADAGSASGGDGVVSLGEAYAYAYDRTVARTGLTDAGTQHPGYDFRLQGRGDLPLTDLSQGSARVILPPELSGPVTILRMPGGAVVAEIAKDPEVAVVLALPPGSYVARLGDQGRRSEARFGLGEGAELVIRDFEAAPLELAARKGEDALSDGEVPGVGPGDADAVADAAGPEAGEAGEAGELAEAEGPQHDQHDQDEEDTGWTEDTDWSEDNSVTGIFKRAEILGRRAARTLEEKVGAQVERWESAVDGPEGDSDPADGEVVADADLDARSDPAAAVSLDEVSVDAASLDDGRAAVQVVDCPLTGPGCLESLAAEGPLPDGPLRLEDAHARPLAGGEILDGRPVGEWVFLHSSGARYARGRYLDGKRSGSWTWWSETGQRLQLGTYISGRRSGQWTEWHDNGKRRQRTTYADDSPSGRQVSWYENGTRRSEGRLLGDQRVGSWTFYHDNGKRRAAGEYSGGQRTGRWITWYANGRRSSRGEYHEDQKLGSWTYWWEGGARSAAGTYVEDLKVGLWREWHADGTKAARGRYLAGRRDGRWISWTPTGERSTVRHHAGSEAAQPAGDVASEVPEVSEVPGADRDDP